MCGINGIFAYHYAANPIDRAELARTRDYMSRRGPDGTGEWFSGDDRLGFGHRRLSIIDLSDAGAQPMFSADGQLVVTFNGEIYNYRELRSRLEAKGHAFRSNSDTEVLLQLYAAMGCEMVHELRGMFAFAIWDVRRGTLFLARDPYGIKPLYYADDGWTFRFASQVKALVAGGGVSKDPEPAGVVGFYLWGSVPEPFTTFQEIRALPAGCMQVVTRIGAGAPKRYHSIAAVYGDAESGGHQIVDAVEAKAELCAALLDSVKHHLVADVPVGAFLSAGIDSGSLVGLMRDAGQQDIQTVTLAFDEFRGRQDDEAPLAEQVARHYGTRHITRVVTEAEFEADLPRILEAMDQPSIDGINTWFASKAAHELGLKVAVSGLGGDELLGSYPSFKDIPRWVGLTSVAAAIPGLGRVARMASQPFFRWLKLNPKAAGMIELGGTYPGAYLLRRGLFMPWELPDVLRDEVIEEGVRRLDTISRIESECRDGPQAAFGKVSALEASLYMRNQLLRDTDWASMAHALEVRVPLVDRVLLQRIAQIGARGLGVDGKKLLARSPVRTLPDAVVNRVKTGFGTPVEHWLRWLKPLENVQGGPSRHWAREWSMIVGASAGLKPRLAETGSVAA